MTVCVATLFQWNDAPVGQPPNWVTSAIVASDRMLTAGDVQYEPFKLKLAEMTTRVIVLVAGDYPLHSQTIHDARKLILSSTNKTPENVARMYGKAIQRIKQREAEDLYLSPLGMNSDTFIAQQKEMSDGFIDRITNQLQSYRGEDVEALVIGSDDTRVHLYTVDSKGIAHCMDDVGFAAIGIGAWHAKSRLMQAGYANTAAMAQALAATYVAKKNAEVAPGVGHKHTDVWVVLKDNIFPLWENVFKSLRDLYDQYEKDREALGTAAVAKLQEVLDETGRKAREGEPSRDTGTHGDVNTPTPKTPPKNESGSADAASS